MTKRIQGKLGDELANELQSNFGPLMSGEALWKTLGFTSAGAFRQSKSQDRLEIPAFSLPNRRGTYAFTKHVAHWLKQKAEEAESDILNNRT